MTYKRKTKDNYIIQLWCPNYGWEHVSEYAKPDYENPYRQCKADLKEYRFSTPDIPYRMIMKREYL